MMNSIQLFAIVSAIIVFLVNALLALLLTRFYLKDKKSISYLVWSAGLRFFAIAVILEILFAFGVYSDFLAKVYLFAITMPILAFSIGHLQFIKSSRPKKYYYYYLIALSLLLLYALFSSTMSSIFNNYIVYGSIPLFPFVVSLIITISSSVVLFYVAISYYIRDKNIKILAIIPGVIIFCIVNILHLQILQLFAYYMQLLGILLMWLGFVGFTKIREYGPGI